MYARSTTIQAQPGSIDAGLAYMQDTVMPRLTEIDGCVGISMLVDRSSGRCIATSSWGSLESMRASDAALDENRLRFAELTGGTDPVVAEWEIAAMHRDHPTSEGTWARVTWVQHQDAERAIDVFTHRIMPAVEAMDGFCSVSFLLDRATAKSCGTVTFDSREALEASREAMQEMRTKAAASVGATIEDVADMELAIAHLRVPELV